MTISKRLYERIFNFYHRKRMIEFFTWDEFVFAVKNLNEIVEDTK